MHNKIIRERAERKSYTMDTIFEKVLCDLKLDTKVDESFMEIMKRMHFFLEINNHTWHLFLAQCVRFSRC